MEAGPMVSIETEVPARGSQAAAISNHVVRTMSEYTGRGPTKARTYINADAVTVVLHDTLTKGEHSLVSDDLDALMLTMRKAFQGTMGQVLIDGVEEILGRKVVAFMSDNHIDPDIAVEVFVLAPADAKHRGDAARGVAKTPTAAGSSWLRTSRRDRSNGSLTWTAWCVSSCVTPLQPLMSRSAASSALHRARRVARTATSFGRARAQVVRRRRPMTSGCAGAIALQ